jgi:alanine-alpha-ketoisovalerate/valine-pyruvate aminotransferase
MQFCPHLQKISCVSNFLYRENLNTGRFVEGTSENLFLTLAPLVFSYFSGGVAFQLESVMYYTHTHTHTHTNGGGFIHIQ